MGYTKKETFKKYFSNPLNRLKTIYSSMIGRCYKKNSSSYNGYGAKGIMVCKEWLEDKQKFYDWAIESGFEYIPNDNGRNKLTLDRIDTTKGYSPDNCRWITMIEQNNNRIDNIYFDYNGESKTLRDWCRVLNLRYPKMYFRIHFKGMSFEEAMKGNDVKIKDKKAKSNYMFIYQQRDGSFSVQIKRKYYGRSKILEDAVNIRNKALEELGLLEEINELEKSKEMK